MYIQRIQFPTIAVKNQGLLPILLVIPPAIKEANIPPF
jgi:hypothetical protein